VKILRGYLLDAGEVVGKGKIKKQDLVQKCVKRMES